VNPKFLPLTLSATICVHLRSSAAKKTLKPVF
jgi:hypothetical protein